MRLWQIQLQVTSQPIVNLPSSGVCPRSPRLSVSGAKGVRAGKARGLALELTMVTVVANSFGLDLNQRMISSVGR